MRNESNSYVTQTINESESVTVTMSNSVNGSTSYSYTEGFKVGYMYDGIFNDVSVEGSFSATQALQDGWSKSTTESRTYTNGTSNTITVPPYSAAVMESGSSDIEVTTRYNCPVGLTYSVDILVGEGSWYPNIDPNAEKWGGLKKTFGPNARKDIYQRWFINGHTVTTMDRENIYWPYFDNPRIGGSWLAGILSQYVPMSSAGGVIRETKKSKKTTYKEFVPLHPLKTIKIETPPDGTAIAGKISYDSYDYLQMSLPIGKSSYTRYFTLGGYNSQGGIFSTFNKDFGHWIVVDENGRELGGDAPVTLDSATGKFTTVSPGKCYLKYLIEEDKYVSADTGERYLTNRDIDRPAIMEITVEEPEYTNKLEITGSYTGIVGVASESIEGEGKLQGAVLDETDAEVEEPYIWKAKQIPSRGINLTEDGMVSFTKPGTFQVRIMTLDKKHYSKWYDVTAKRGDDSSYIIIDDDDLPPVIDDEDYRIADESAVIFVEGSFDGSANGEAVSLEGKDKLTVYAEDLSGQELPIKYEWEQMENEGLVLSKDGKAVFTKPGNYFVRVRSGEIYSDWVEITAKVPAEVKRAPVAIDRVFDGRTRNLVERGVAVGGKIAYVVMIDPWSVPSEANFEEEWASEIPAATDAGTYYVWYMVKGDDNHTDTTPVCIPVTISAVETVTITFDAGGGTGSMAPVGIEKGSKFTFPAPEFFPPADRAFAHWKIGEKQYGIDDAIIVTADVTVTAVWTEPKSRIETNDLTTVPEELKNTYSSITALKKALLSRLLSNGIFASEENTEFHDVELQVLIGGEWVKATKEYFPKDKKLSVTLPYPVGTGMNTHDFTVAHMFTVEMHGHQPGQIETPPVAKGESGITVELDGLSPVAISWNKIDEKAIGSLPQTGDTAKPLLYGFLALIALVGLGLLIKKK